MAGTYTGILTRITAGGTGQQAIDKLNLPLSEIEAVFNELDARITGLANKTAVVKKGAPLSDACYQGYLVYFNTTTMRYEPALSDVLDTYGDQGQLLEAPTAHVVGIVLSVDTNPDGLGNVQGTLLLGGYWDDINVVNGFAGSGAAVGIYYLSPTTAGKATLTPSPNLRQPILVYEGDGKFVMGLQYMAQDNHSPVVREIQSANDALTVETENGVAMLTQNDFETDDMENSATAISDIVGKKLKLTPVISGLQAGPGMAVDVDQNGVATLASSANIGTPVDAYSINHNGSTLTSDGTFLYLTFPEGRQSAMVISAPVPGLPNGMSLDAKVWCCNAGSSASLSARCYWLPTPTASSPVQIPANPTDLGSLPLSGASGQLTYAESTGSMTVSGDGQLVAVLETSVGGPADDVKLTRVGFIFNFHQAG